MLSKFITRPDVKKLHMSAFVDWLLMRMKSVDRMTMLFHCVIATVVKLLLIKQA